MHRRLGPQSAVDRRYCEAGKAAVGGEPVPVDSEPGGTSVEWEGVNMAFAAEDDWNQRPEQANQTPDESSR